MSINPGSYGEDVDEYLTASITSSSKRQYRVGWKWYLLHMKSLNYTTTEVLAPTVRMILTFTIHLVRDRGLNIQTMKSYVSHVKYYLLKNGGSTLEFHYDIMNAVAKGLGNIHGNRFRVRRAITIDEWRWMSSLLDCNSHRGLSMLTLGTIMITRLLRCGELCKSSTEAAGLLRRSITWYTDRCEMNLGRTKTDSPGQETIITIDKNNMKWCGYTLLKSLYNQCPDQRTNAAVFQTEAGSPLTTAMVLNSVRELVQRFGYDPKLYGTHSFRIGGATTLHLLGVAMLDIQRLGRWKSDTVERYIRLSPTVLSRISDRLAQELNQ